MTWRADGTAKVDFYTVDGKVRYKTDNREGGGTDYVYLGDQLVAEHKGPWRSTRGTIYTHTDHLGSPIVRTNNLAHVYSRDRRTNFGAPLTLNPVEAEAGYTGHIEDPEQGLVYMQQRYYDPAIARFLSVDPVGPLADPSNHFGRYHYAYNNPYRYTDPDGRLPVLIPVAIVAWRAYSAYDTASTIASSVSTLSDPNASGMEKAIAGAEIAGSLVGGKYGREGAGAAVRMADDVSEAARSGRGANHLRPDPNAEGAHSTFRRDQNGSITNTATYEPNPQNPSGFQETKRVDVIGREHTNPDGTVMPTPHVHESGSKAVRPAKPEELPKR